MDAHVDLAFKFFGSIGSDFLERFGTLGFFLMDVSVVNFWGYPHGFSTARSV
jgi:hypothetical protein